MLQIKQAPDRPESGFALVVALHLRKRQILLSIAVGMVCYMLLVWFVLLRFTGSTVVCRGACFYFKNSAILSAVYRI